ncbi:glucoamylase family protein [Flammeovirga agarivorans]|uniref:glucoamylase family protein n=1 Tax=Flammeovirga agarivorans TaxID=2726742 RepID=UPI001F32A105|nr:glucoamylase family protein [Flammeovirga agarivorans]
MQYTNFKTILTLLLFSLMCCSETVKISPELPIYDDEEEKVSLTDEELMDKVQETTFKYFWDYGHPVSALSRERSNGDDEIVTTGGTGFGIMAIIVGVERGYITKAEAAQRLVKMYEFLENADRFHGAFPHWYHGSTGKVKPFSQKDDGGDLVETAFLIEGIITSRNYFDGDNETEIKLRTLATALWEGVDWEWYRNGTDKLYWHWSPQYDFQMNMPLYGFEETQITHLLAVASPTYPVPASTYETCFKNGEHRYEQSLTVDTAKPLFWVHYSYIGLEPHFTDGTTSKSYFELFKERTLENRRWCIEQQVKFPYYGENAWGLTASDDPFEGYMAHEPSQNLDNGTITPTAALSSIVYTPEESLAAMRYFYEEQPKLWGEYGFKDAYNLSQGDWYAESYLAIDQGPIITMIENYRSGVLWKYFMMDKDIQRGIETLNWSFTSVN